MNIVLDTRDKLLTRYTSRGSVYILLFFPFIIFFYALCLMRSHVTIDCMKAAGPLGTDDYCSISSLSTLGSSSLARRIFPTFMTGHEYRLSIPHIKQFTVREFEHTTSHDGYDEVEYSYGVYYEQETIPSTLKLPPKYSTDNYGEVYDFGSDQPNARDLARKLNIYVSNIKANPNILSVFNYKVDERWTDELLILCSGVCMILLGIYYPVLETIHCDGVSGTLHYAKYSLLGHCRENIVLPIVQIDTIHISEHLETQSSSSNSSSSSTPNYVTVYKVRLILNKLRENETFPGLEPDPDHPDKLCLGLFLKHSFNDVSVAQQHIGRLRSWLTEFRDREKRRIEREKRELRNSLQASVMASSPTTTTTDSSSTGVIGSGTGSGDNTDIPLTTFTSGSVGSEESDMNLIRRGGSNGHSSFTSSSSSSTSGGTTNTTSIASNPTTATSSSSSSTTTTTSSSSHHHNSDLCSICYEPDKEVRAVFLPCKHMVCCNDCADQMDKCPVCRTGIDSVFNVYR